MGHSKGMAGGAGTAVQYPIVGRPMTSLTRRCIPAGDFSDEGRGVNVGRQAHGPRSPIGVGVGKIGMTGKTVFAVDDAGKIASMTELALVEIPTMGAEILSVAVRRSPEHQPRHLGRRMTEIRRMASLAGVLSRRGLIQTVSMADLAGGDVRKRRRAMGGSGVPSRRMGIRGMTTGASRSLCDRGGGNQSQTMTTLRRAGTAGVRIHVSSVGPQPSGVMRIRAVAGVATDGVPASFEIRPMTAFTIVFSISQCDVSVRGRQDPTGGMGVIRMAGIAGDMGEPPLQIRPVTLGGASGLTVCEHVASMIAFIRPLIGMGK